MLFFLIAFFFYIDGVYTIIDMATAYGTALGLDTTGLLLALLVTQIVAFPAALLFGRLSGKYKNAVLIRICIGAYFLIALYGITLKEQYQFWILLSASVSSKEPFNLSPAPISPGSSRRNVRENTLESMISAGKARPSSAPRLSPL